MIAIDPRRGSGDLLRYFAGTGVPAMHQAIEYGDVAFIGEGPDGVPLPVGIEIKQVSDALNCVTTGRFAGHQLLGMIQAYREPWLLIEGDYRSASGVGTLELRHVSGKYWFDATVGSRGFMYRDFDKWLLTQLIKGGLRYMRTYNRQETVQFIRDLYAWWQEGWDAHKSHLAPNTSMEDQRDTALLVKPSLLREWAAKLPGIGWVKAGAVERHFGTIEHMMWASMKEWQEIEGIGKVLASKVWSVLHDSQTCR